IIKQDKAKQVARDEKLVPTNDKVKIGNNNLRIDPSMTQREETFQVTLDILKNTPFYNTFLISTNIDVDIFIKILDISLKVENQEFIKPPSSDTLREFLRELGYKGKLAKSSEICLSRKTLSNDRLRLSRIEILWSMYHEAKVDYAAMMWEDL
ncbi:hypothetical protein Tco_1098978, partial [Tanacetum coccineum]